MHKAASDSSLSSSFQKPWPTSDWCRGSQGIQNLVAIFRRYYWPVLTSKAGCIGKYGKNWLLNPGTSSQSEGYSSKWLIWLVCREPLLMYCCEPPVCTKTPRFPYILLPTQEVWFYFIAMTVLNVCAFIISCLRPCHIQHPLYYCSFIWGISNICVWGGTAKGYQVMEVSSTYVIVIKSRFEREITRRLTRQETSINILNYWW